jgi:hypothetical protein
LKILRGKDLELFKATLIHDVLALKYRKLNSITVIPHKALLRIGMLLRDSEVAKALRSYLLNVKEIARKEAPRVLT